MQSALEIGNENTTNLVDAVTLKGMTATRESIYEKEKASLLDQLMSTMVRIATESGKNGYVARLDPKFDQVILNDINKVLTDLGYVVLIKEEELPSIGKFISLDISW